MSQTGGLKKTMLPEKDYYPIIEKFLEKRFNCISTGIGKGYLALGLVDVVGAYDISGELLNDIEVIVVEVKKTTSSFGKSIGQALGYSTYGERCYLAIPFKGKETYNEDHKYIADHLGVGLIRIPLDKKDKPRRSKTEMVLSSKRHDPIPSQKHKLLYSIGITRCSLCSLYDKKEKMYQLRRHIGRPGMFTNSDLRRTFLCEDCFSDVISKREKEKIQTLLDGGKKAAKTRKRRNAARKAVETRKENRQKKEES